MALTELRVEGRVAQVTINRPEAMNSLNSDLLKALLETFEDLAYQPEVGVVVLTGAGTKAFVAGADIREMKDKGPEEARIFADLGQRVTRRIERLPQPVIAAVNGYALGGGCEIALACDFRLCSDNARFGQPEINLGIIPGFGGTQRLARTCGLGFARELIYTGRMIDAQEALSRGLVNAVYGQGELLDQARDKAALIASKSAVALRYAKLATSRALEQDLPGGLGVEADLFGLCFAAEDHREGIDAYLEKRTAVFRHR